MRVPALRKLLLGATSTALALTGCGGGSGGTGYANFVWDIFDIQDTSDSHSLTCGEVGAATIAVTLRDLAGNTATQDSVACTDVESARYISTGDVAAGAYNASFDMYGDQRVYGNSTTWLDGFTASDPGTGNYTVFHLRAGANNFSNHFAPLIAQRFTVSWGIYSQGAPSNCTAVGASFVYLDFMTLDPTPSATVSTPFPCGNASGISYAIPFGPTSVQWSLSLTDSNGQALQALSGGPLTLPSNTNVNLPPQSFSF
jgi:hypothetical protein